MNTIRINTTQATPGMIAAEDIFNSSGQIIIPKGVMLTDKAITRLRFHSVTSFRILSDEEITELSPITAIPTAEERTYFDKLRETEEFAVFNVTFNKTVVQFENRLKDFLGNADEIRTDDLMDSVKTLLGSCRTGIQVFDLLHCLRGYDDLTFVHSVNVALICAVFGSWLGYKTKDIDILILCGIFHDIGKLTIPHDIIAKPGKLTSDEYTIVKEHTLRGYSALKNRSVNKHIKMAALMHHERCDGSGYPLGLTGERIDTFAKIVAIADVYDAMTCARVYRSAVPPFEVIHIFETEGLSIYDTKFVLTFIEHISQSYLGTGVRLSDGRSGKIVFINRQAYSRPMIQIGDEYVDLSKTAELEITALL